MNYVTEAKRLGLTHRTAEFSTLGDYIYPDMESEREDRLCVSNCESCREFRNNVRSMLAAEAAERQRPIDEAFRRGLDLGRLQGAVEATKAIRADLVKQHNQDIADLDAIIEHEEAILYGAERA